MMAIQSCIVNQKEREVVFEASCNNVLFLGTDSV